MFDEVGKNYDLTNTVLSFGLDAYWRRRATALLNPRPGERILDVAAGTAVSTARLARTGATCVACDFSYGMLRAGSRRAVSKVVGDALRLPFADASFDAVTISYGLRNVADVPQALREFARVTKAGGRLVVNEFSTPVVPIFGAVYKKYLPKALPVVARAVSSNPEAYVYLAESIRSWPGQWELARLIDAHGWRECGWRNLTGGVVALHSAVKRD